MSIECGHLPSAVPQMPAAIRRAPVLSRIHAVVPVKALDRAKSRLAGILSPAERRNLALLMLRRVLGVLGAHRLPPPPAHHTHDLPALSEVWLLSPDEQVLRLAAEIGVRPLYDQATDLNAALEQARDAVQQAGAEALLVVPADLPVITPEDISRLLTTLASGADMVIAPDGASEGTNALALRLPSPLRFQFGSDSCALHLAAAARLQLNVAIIHSPSLALDVDTPESLTRFQALL